VRSFDVSSEGMVSRIAVHGRAEDIVCTAVNVGRTTPPSTATVPLWKEKG
jgi:hypothetical protein